MYKASSAKQGTATEQAAGEEDATDARAETADPQEKTSRGGPKDGSVEDVDYEVVDDDKN